MENFIEEWFNLPVWIPVITIYRSFFIPDKCHISGQRPPGKLHSYYRFIRFCCQKDYRFGCCGRAMQWTNAGFTCALKKKCCLVAWRGSVSFEIGEK